MCGNCGISPFVDRHNVGFIHFNSIIMHKDMAMYNPHGEKRCKKTEFTQYMYHSNLDVIVLYDYRTE